MKRPAGPHQILKNPGLPIWSFPAIPSWRISPSTTEKSRPLPAGIALARSIARIPLLERNQYRIAKIFLQCFLNTFSSSDGVRCWISSMEFILCSTDKISCSGPNSAPLSILAARQTHLKHVGCRRPQQIRGTRPLQATPDISRWPASTQAWFPHFQLPQGGAHQKAANRECGDSPCCKRDSKGFAESSAFSSQSLNWIIIGSMATTVDYR